MLEELGGRQLLLLLARKHRRQLAACVGWIGGEGDGHGAGEGEGDDAKGTFSFGCVLANVASCERPRDEEVLD